MKKLAILITLLLITAGCFINHLDTTHLHSNNNNIVSYETKGAELVLHNLYRCSADSTSTKARYLYIADHSIVYFICDKQGDTWYRTSDFYKSMSLDPFRLHIPDVLYTTISIEPNQITLNNEDKFVLTIINFNIDNVKDKYNEICFNPSVSNWN